MKFFYIFSLLFLVYLLLPGPYSVTNFPDLPQSSKSGLSGDTWQVSNVSAYFSNNYREFATNFYNIFYQQKTPLPFPPIRLNYPPEFAYTAIKDQTQSTYLEEFVYPLRDSLYVNGLEPFYEDGVARYKGATPFVTKDGQFFTKVTLRYYPSTLPSRLVVWFGICLSALLVWRVGRKVLKYG